MKTVAIDQIVTPAHQREIDTAHAHEIAAKMRERGYNVSYPITINKNNELVDGGHRVEAARLIGLESVPFVYKPDGVSDVQHSIICNQDGAETKPDDVFDLAHRCWALSQQGLSGQQIGEVMGWKPQLVTYHKNIREKLCADAWELTRKSTLGNSADNSLVNSKLTIVNWKETHFRALLKHLPHNHKSPDDIVAQEQISAIQTILLCFAGEIKISKHKKRKVTAAWIDEIAQMHAWRAKLKTYARENIASWVQDETRANILENIDSDTYGTEYNSDAWGTFVRAIEAANGKAPQLYVGQAEDMHFIESASVDVIITSPPYNIGSQNMPMGGDGRAPREGGIGYDQHDDAMDESDYRAWQLACLKEMYRVAKDGASLFYNHKVRNKDGRATHPMEWIGHPENPWMLRQEIVWDRGSTHNHNPGLFWPHDERIYWLTKNRPALGSKSIGKPTVWREHGPVANTWHPAPFTSQLPRMCLDALGLKSAVVLDPFAGSCTTIKVATSEYGYDAIGVDISEEYLDKAKEENRWTHENKA